MRKILAISGVNLRRLIRERANIFFLILLPFLIVIFLGEAFGGSKAPIGIVYKGSPVHAKADFAQELITQLEHTHGLKVVHYDSSADMVNGVQKGDVDAGIVIPKDYNKVVITRTGVPVDYYARPVSQGAQIKQSIQTVISKQSLPLTTAHFLQHNVGGNFTHNLKLATSANAALNPLNVNLIDTVGKKLPEVGQFDEGASTQLVLFIFLTSLSTGVFLIETRRLGITRRELGTPTRISTILFGELLGHFGIALMQAFLIIVGSAIVFGVNWSNPVGVVAITVLFCLAGSGAGVLLGSTLRNEQQASSMALLIGLGLAALGGSMVPLEVFPNIMRQIADFTPHAWANDAFNKLRAGGGLSDIVTNIAVLFGFCVALISLASWRLRKVLTT
jgi:ABC-2 type transport system permease protein